MRCPSCDGTDNRVVDTRTSRAGRAVRRRRECLDCGERFTTYEYVEARTIQVLKRDGSAEEFDREKLMRGLRIATAKRSVSPSRIESLVDEIQDELSRQAGVEVPSSLIGGNGDGAPEAPGPGGLRPVRVSVPELPGCGRVSTLCRRSQRQAAKGGRGSSAGGASALTGLHDG
jgi:transcriptional repressor NrdR